VDILIVSKSRKEMGPSLIIRCPKCGAEAAPAIAYRQIDELSAFFFIKLLTVKNNFVECSKCRGRLRCDIDIDELEQYMHGELDQFLSHDVSFVVKFLAIASISLSIAPLVGLILSLVTVLLTLKSSGWTRTLARVGLVVSAIVTGLAIAAILLDR
jgi:hypothetical protein